MRLGEMNESAKNQAMESKISSNIDAVSEEEIDWMLAHRNLEFDLSRCLKDYPKYGNDMVQGNLCLIRMSNISNFDLYSF